MPGVKHLFAGRRPRPRDDAGSIQVLFGVLVGSGMLLAMLAVVVDGGRLEIEHAELRSGADAAALAVARGCAEAPGGAACDLSADPAGVAGRLANANAGDDAAAVNRICGRGPGIEPCPAPGAGSLATCIDPAPATGSYIEVSTKTRLPDGTTVFPPVVAGSVFGTYEGTTVGACARASWGTPIRIDRAFPIMISACAWRQATADGTQFTAAPSPSWDPPDTEEDVVHANSTACESDPSSAEGDLAVLLGPADVTCHQPLRTGDEVSGFPGDNLLSGIATGFCQGRILLTWLEETLRELFADGRPRVIYLPVYDQVQTIGIPPLATYRYRVAGFAAFEPTGALFGAMILPSWRTGGLCGLSPPCLRGFFTRKALRGRIAPGGEEFGVYAVQLSG